MTTIASIGAIVVCEFTDSRYNHRLAVLPRQIDRDGRSEFRRDVGWGKSGRILIGVFLQLKMRGMISAIVILDCPFKKAATVCL
jgi:hypothetical protein